MDSDNDLMTSSILSLLLPFCEVGRRRSFYFWGQRRRRQPFRRRRRRLSSTVVARSGGELGRARPDPCVNKVRWAPLLSLERVHIHIRRRVHTCIRQLLLIARIGIYVFWHASSSRFESLGFWRLDRVEILARRRESAREKKGEKACLA